MTDLVAQLVGALERLSGQCERMRLPGQPMSDAEKNAIAALSAAKDGGWLPIETAPKDGAEVLVGSTVSPFAFAVASWDGEEWRDIGDIGWAGMTGENNQPTHWQPLPNPPKEQA